MGIAPPRRWFCRSKSLLLDGFGPLWAGIALSIVVLRSNSDGPRDPRQLDEDSRDGRRDPHPTGGCLRTSGAPRLARIASDCWQNAGIRLPARIAKVMGGCTEYLVSGLESATGFCLGNCGARIAHFVLARPVRLASPICQRSCFARHSGPLCTGISI